MMSALDLFEVPVPESGAEKDPAKKRGGGPRTPEGKERSRRNALKHGLRARVLLPDDLAAAVAERAAELTDEFEPGSAYEEWLVGEMALASTRLDRCAELAIADLQRCVDRATLCWEGDRRQIVEDLGARLSREPSRIAWALRQSRQGADWLIERWEGLGEVLRANGAWDEAQRRLAFDLLGVPPELRQGSTKVPPETDAGAMAELVARQVARLRDDQEAVLDELDEATRGMATAGMPMDEDATTARLRRYEASCRRALHWALAELRRVQSGSGSRPAVEFESPRPSFANEKPDGDDRTTRAGAVVETIKKPEPTQAVEPAAVVKASGVPTPPAPVFAPFRSKPVVARNRRERRAQERRARKADLCDSCR